MSQPGPFPGLVLERESAGDRARQDHGKLWQRGAAFRSRLSAGRTVPGPVSIRLLSPRPDGQGNIPETSRMPPGYLCRFPSGALASLRTPGPRADTAFVALAVS